MNHFLWKLAVLLFARLFYKWHVQFHEYIQNTLCLQQWLQAVLRENGFLVYIITLKRFHCSIISMNGNWPFNTKDVPSLITGTSIWKQITFAFSDFTKRRLWRKGAVIRHTEINRLKRISHTCKSKISIWQTFLKWLRKVSEVSEIVYIPKFIIFPRIQYDWVMSLIRTSALASFYYFREH